MKQYSLIKASAADAGIFQRLLQFYYYDFSAYLQFDLMANGSFDEFIQLDHYWQSCPDHVAYLVKVQQQYAGFVMVKRSPALQQQFSIAEFFILKKYRRNGTGTAVACEIFDRHRGHWKVQQHIKNNVAQSFWRTVINRYSKGFYIESIEKEKRVQEFSNLA